MGLGDGSVPGGILTGGGSYGGGYGGYAFASQVENVPDRACDLFDCAGVCGGSAAARRLRRAMPRVRERVRDARGGARRASRADGVPHGVRWCGSGRLPGGSGWWRAHRCDGSGACSGIRRGGFCAPPARSMRACFMRWLLTATRARRSNPTAVGLRHRVLNDYLLHLGGAWQWANETDGRNCWAGSACESPAPGAPPHMVGGERELPAASADLEEALGLFPRLARAHFEHPH